VRVTRGLIAALGEQHSRKLMLAEAPSKDTKSGISALMKKV